MKTFNEGFGGGDSEPSRRDVVKYGAAAAIAVAAGPVMAATAANTVSGFQDCYIIIFLFEFICSSQSRKSCTNNYYFRF